MAQHGATQHLCISMRFTGFTHHVLPFGIAHVPKESSEDCTTQKDRTKYKKNQQDIIKGTQMTQNTSFPFIHPFWSPRNVLLDPLFPLFHGKLVVRARMENVEDDSWFPGGCWMHAIVMHTYSMRLEESPWQVIPVFPKCYPISLNDTKWDINKTCVTGRFSPFPPSLLHSFTPSLLPSFPRSLAWLSCRLSNCHPCLGCRRGGAPGSSVASCECHA